MKTKLFFLVAFCYCLIPASASNTNLPPTALISYNSPFCQGNSIVQSVMITGTGNYTGGTYSAAPSGLSITSSTGAINPSLSVAGNYEVTYTIPAGVDPEVQVSTSIQIVNVPNAGIDGAVTVCDASAMSINLFSLISGEQTGGVWTRTSGTGGIFNTAAGTFLPLSGATSSSFIYSIQGISPCVSDTSIATITINQQPNPGYGSTVSICDTDATPVDLFNILSGEQPGGIWTRTSGTGGTLNAVTGIFTPALGNTTSSSFTYSVTGVAPCNNATSTVTLNIGSEISLPYYFPDVYTCMYFMIPQVQTGNFYTASGGGGQLLVPGTEITWSQTIYFYMQSGTCSGEDSFNVTIVPEIIPMFNPIPEQCLGSPAIGLPQVSANGVSGTWSPSVINNSILGTTVYTFTPNPDNCGASTTLVVTVVPCAGIELNAFLDINGNGTEDSGEPKFPLGHFEYEANNDSVIHQGLAPNGTYSIIDYNVSNSYDISYTIDAPDNLLYNVTTPSFSNVVSGDPHPTYNFPVTVIASHSALEVSLSPIGFPRAGNSCVNHIRYSNTGNVAITSGTITFTHDAALSFDVANIPGVIPTTTGFTYDFTNLAPFETRSFSASMTVPPLPTVLIGQLVTNSVNISAGEVSDSNSLTQPIVAAYDPNDKVESHGGKIVFADFTAEDYLYYTIRFENTGNADAFNVNITDILDAQLDESTVRLVSASHSYVLEKTGRNLNFIFADINLAPSMVNTEIGKGFVTFKVKPKTGFAIGNVIPNIASIYFDFNPAIETNTFQTEFVAQLSKSNFETNAFSIYPNPSSDEFRVVSNGNNPISAIHVYSFLGKMILSKAARSNSEVVNIQSLSAGIYLVEIVSGETKTIKKLLVK